MRKHLFIGLLYAGITALCYQPHYVAAKDTGQKEFPVIVKNASAYELKAPVPVEYYTISAYSRELLTYSPVLMFTAKKTSMAVFSHAIRRRGVSPSYVCNVKGHRNRLCHIDPGLRGC